MTHGWYNGPHRNGPPASKPFIVIVALILFNVYFNNIILKIGFAIFFWGIWAMVLYAVLLRPIYNLILKLFKKIW
jgi:hypothetical protein